MPNQHNHFSDVGSFLQERECLLYCVLFKVEGVRRQRCDHAGFQFAGEILKLTIHPQTIMIPSWAVAAAGVYCYRKKVHTKARRCTTLLAPNEILADLGDRASLSKQ